MKRLISDIRIINSIYGTWKPFLLQQSIVTVFSIVMYQATSLPVSLLFILIMPSMYTYVYLKFYAPAIRAVEDELDREKEYKFLSNRFNKVN